MKKYKHKRQPPPEQLRRRLHKSDFYKRLKKRSQEIESDPRFKAEYAELKNKYPLPAPKPLKNGWVHSGWIYSGKETFIAWRNFCEKWGINSFNLFHGKVFVEWPIETLYEHGEPIEGGGHKMRLFFEITGQITETELRELAPWMAQEIKGKFNHKGLGRPPGPSKETFERNKEIRFEYRSHRQKGKKSESIIELLQKKNELSDHTIRSVVYSRKFD